MEFLSPSCGFPRLREGNQKGSVPPACRGNLTEGLRASPPYTPLPLTQGGEGRGEGDSNTHSRN